MGTPLDVLIQLLSEITHDTVTIYRLVLTTLILDTLSALATGLILDEKMEGASEEEKLNKLQGRFFPVKLVPARNPHYVNIEEFY